MSISKPVKKKHLQCPYITFVIWLTWPLEGCRGYGYISRISTTNWAVQFCFIGIIIPLWSCFLSWSKDSKLKWEEEINMSYLRSKQCTIQDYRCMQLCLLGTVRYVICSYRLSDISLFKSLDLFATRNTITILVILTECAFHWQRYFLVLIHQLLLMLKIPLVSQMQMSSQFLRP